MPRSRPYHAALALLAALLVLFLAQPGRFASARTAEEWKSRSIYQVITDRFALPPPSNSTAPCANIHSYCGGTYTGLAARLDYIAALGFNAIWISPVVANTPNAFHGYSAQNLYELNAHFGTRQEFVDLIAACHARDMWVMVDVVGNHMAAVGSDYSQLVPFDKAEYFHDCAPQWGCARNCWIPDSVWATHNLTTIEHCQLDGLSDLDQDNPYVRATLLDWIHDLVRNYSIDGLRIDTVPEVKPAFWAEWQERAGVYAFGEVFDQDVPYVAQYQGPLNATLSYPLFFAMRNVFAQGQPMSQLTDLFDTYDKHFADPSILATFADNHDNARFLNLTTDSAAYLNALAYTLTSRGVPIVYYGTEQGYHGATDPYDREPLWESGYATGSVYYDAIVALNRWRSSGGWDGGDQRMLSASDSVLVYARGNTTLCVLTNIGQHGAKQSVTVTGLTWWADGQVLVSAFNDADAVTVKGGSVTVTLVGGLPKVYSIFPIQAVSAPAPIAAPSQSSSSSSTGGSSGVVVGAERNGAATAGVQVVAGVMAVLVSVALM